MNFAIALKFVRVFNNLTKSSHLLYKIPFSFGPTDPPVPLPYPLCYSALLPQSPSLSLLLLSRTSRRATAENFACKSHINTEKLTTGRQEELRGAGQRAHNNVLAGIAKRGRGGGGQSQASAMMALLMATHYSKSRSQIVNGIRHNECGQRERGEECVAGVQRVCSSRPLGMSKLICR